MHNPTGKTEACRIQRRYRQTGNFTRPSQPR